MSLPDPKLEFGPQHSASSSSERKAEELTRPAIRRRGWRKIVRNFTPSWFSVNMGTGIVSILLHNLPYNGNWLYWLSVVVFALNVLLFVLFTFISTLRYIIWPELWSAVIRHPAQSLFLGTYPIGLVTIINMIVYVCVPSWGRGMAYFAWGLWWFDVVLSVFVCLYLPFVITYYHKNELSAMTAAWLLPVAAAVVVASSGGIVAEVLPNRQYAVWTILASYILWGTGVPLALIILVIYFHRLSIYSLPPREVIVSVFLPLGPLGQGGAGIMQLGKVALKVFPKTHTLETNGIEDAAKILYVVGWMIGIVMWGFGVVWLFFAIASISRSRFPFNMGWWGFTFPLGVFTVSTTILGKEIPSRFFSVLGTILSVVVVLLWLMVSAGTLWKLSKGELLFAPCLKEVEGTEQAVINKHFGSEMSEEDWEYHKEKQ